MNSTALFKNIFEGWQIESVLGEGTYGKVYLASRTEFGVTYHAAVKHVGIPRNDAEINSLRTEGGYTEAVMGDYFEDIMETYVKEIRVMYELKGNTNIVSYEDHKVVKRKNAVGYDIFIRMEKLESVSKIISKKELTQTGVAKLGVDICKALEILAAKNIIHRDIKLGNLFVNDNGDYKLGDFGKARQIDINMSMKSGTLNFMSPEVFKSQQYDATADIYSLGMALYRLLNANRGPFLPLTTEFVRPSDDEKALSRRMSGEEIPRPAYADDVLGRIVLKACAYDPRMRFQTASGFRAVLQQYAGGNAARVLPVWSPESGIPSASEHSETGGVFDEPAPSSRPSYGTANQDLTEGVFDEPIPRNEPPFREPSYQTPYYADTGTDATEGVFGQSAYTPTLGEYRPVFELETPEAQHTTFTSDAFLMDCEPVEYGGYTFSCGSETNHCLYRVNRRTGERDMISNGRCWGFVMDNGRIYYASDSGGIYAVFFNKSESMSVTEDSAAFPVFSGGFVYYANQSEDGAIYRVKPDGSGHTIVSRDCGWYLKIYSGQLFYSDASDGFSLCSVALDGFQKSQYGVRGCHYLHVYSGWAVFSHDSANGAICKLNIRTKETVKLNNEPGIVTAVRGGRVYYKTDINGAVHQLRLDGRS